MITAQLAKSLSSEEGNKRNGVKKSWNEREKDGYAYERKEDMLKNCIQLYAAYAGRVHNWTSRGR